jgi:hypothetical protein
MLKSESLLSRVFPPYPSEEFPQNIHGFPLGKGNASTKWKTAANRHSESAWPTTYHGGLAWLLSGRKRTEL